jgi:hypothetical protein
MMLIARSNVLIAGIRKRKDLESIVVKAPWKGWLQESLILAFVAGGISLRRDDCFKYPRVGDPGRRDRVSLKGIGDTKFCEWMIYRRRNAESYKLELSIPIGGEMT